jgi:hypothetical protein
MEEAHREKRRRQATKPGAFVTLASPLDPLLEPSVKNVIARVTQAT